jgi:hypothetical protein
MMKSEKLFQEVEILPSKEFENSDRLQNIERRGIKQRLIAQARGIEFFDGERENGYGGFVYDGRWAEVAKKIYDLGELSPGSKVLQINCEKGFLLYEFQRLAMNLQLVGTESSSYALENVVNGLNSVLMLWNTPKLPFYHRSIDFLIAIGYPYTLNLTDFVTFISECNRTSKASFITLASYVNQSDYEVFRSWSLLGTLIYRKEDWRIILSNLGFRGYVQFIDAKFLGLLSREEKHKWD